MWMILRIPDKISLLRRNWNCRKEGKRYQSVSRWTVILLIHLFLVSASARQSSMEAFWQLSLLGVNTLRTSKILKCFPAPLHLFFKLIYFSGCSELWRRFLCFVMFRDKFRVGFSKWFLVYSSFFPGISMIRRVSLKLLLWSHCLNSKNQWQRRSPRILSESLNFSFMFPLLPNSLWTSCWDGKCFTYLAFQLRISLLTSIFFLKTWLFQMQLFQDSPMQAQLCFHYTQLK